MARKSRSLAVATVGAVLAALTARGAAPETGELIPNWQAPPFWAPPAGEPQGDGAGEAAARTAVGRSALAGGTTALPFVALFPCRLVDTRGNAPLTGGFLPAATVRSYTLTGVCNVPPNAKAISLNATVVHPTGPGFLTLYPEGGAFPPVSTLNYLGNDVIVNAAVVPLSATGGISMALGVSGGDVILDTNGYYADAADVASVNGLTGDVTLSAGANVTLTPSGNTLTIASSAGSGPPTGAAGGSLSGAYPNPGIADGAVTDAKIAGVSWGKVTGAPGFVLKTGDTMTGSLAVNTGNVYLTASSSPSTGSIFKSGSPFLHDFGTNNTFVGSNAGNFTMTGTDNTACGYAALNSNTSGYSNTAYGSGALASNSTGISNTASGYWALHSNTTGGANTASGTGALYVNTTGSYNTASGLDALLSNTTGSYNTASGYVALYWNTTGAQNTAVGNYGLAGNTTGFQNTALGDLAGYRSGASTGYSGGAITYVPLTTGSYNTFLGRGTGATAAGISNCTAVGIDAYCDANDQVRLGNIFVGSIGGKVAWSSLSDARAKRDIRDLSVGLDFVLGLRPVEYRLKIGNGRMDMGFLAQDIQAALGDGYNVVTVGGDPDRTLSLRYTDLIAPLVKAIQEQQETIRNDRRTIEELAARLARLEARLESPAPSPR